MDRALRQDLSAALALALVLGIGWTLRDWPALSALRLPDTDDVMRLQQIRDWLGGQRFDDLTQHRLGAGVPMHWTRLADLGPAAILVALRPLAGVQTATLAAVIAWPLLLFAAALVLVARIARGVGAPAATAVVIAAIAYPATTVFLPGRIDHHGLQVVLLLAATVAAAGRASLRSGVLIGLATAASLVVGLETAPLLAVLCGVVAIEAAIGDTSGVRRLQALGIALLVGLTAACPLFAPAAWSYPACDGFTATLWRAAMIGGAGLAALGMMLTSARLATKARRLAMLGVAGAATVAAVIVVAPGCAAPYGGVDPELARWWLARVAEAQPLFAAPAGTAIGYAGVMAAGLATTAWQWLHHRSRGWAVLMALQLAAAAVTLAQLRGAYAGAMLAAPALATLVAAARRRGALPLAGAWVVSAGMLYPIAADAFARRGRDTPTATPCTAPAVIARLAALPPATVMAPIDVGPWAIAATRHRLVAGPYHRNTAGNLAMLGFFRAPPDEARRIAAQWHVGYVLLCDGDAPALTRGRDALASRIVGGRAPVWLRPLDAAGSGVHLFAIGSPPS